ncbi:23S rRNA (adenine(2503)-C(2))-methyltransferase RlmN [Campylobacter concisus]|uniref:23S rRNA (adenine(2503)-C(2))-methyltransferase RlmN n=1 Tax=Campylobacter concisus TaxID=199 RepID=UPI000CD9DEC6|nr:23S rRNA (adenine(2503)-C(2))-methyltransferase RlmN [Campylobacter concisus]
MKNLLDLSIEELKELVSPSFRATQIYEWVYKKNATEFSQMLNLPKDMRQYLAEKFYLDPLKCVKFEQSSDGSIKYLFELKDGLKIESVLLPMKEEISDEDGKVSRHARYTVCVSSQVGCKMGCAFCLTAKGGLVRNLTAGEVVGQILWIKRENNIPYERRINVVYMGMGEPLDNLTNVSKAIKILALNEGLAISPRRQTVSTSGLGSQIKKLGEMDLGVLLAISLHAVTNELRSRLMPINKAYNIEAVMDAVRGFPIDMRKRVMFEYLVIKDLNDSVSDAKKLVKLLHGIKAKVNLIYFNPHEGSEFGRPELSNMLKFQEYLRDHGVTCTIRQSKGLDISAACGQLKQRNENPKFKTNVIDKSTAKAEEKPTNDKTNVSKK